MDRQEQLEQCLGERFSDETLRRALRQLGYVHKRHQREPFDESEIDFFWDDTCTACPDCGGPVEPSEQTPRTLQQVELVVRPVRISEHRGQAAHCQRTHHAPIHEDIRRAGLVGPRLEDVANELEGQVKFGVPRTPEAENLADRFWEHGASYLRFLTALCRSGSASSRLLAVNGYVVSCVLYTTYAKSGGLVVLSR